MMTLGAGLGLRTRTGPFQIPTGPGPKVKVRIVLGRWWRLLLLGDVQGGARGRRVDVPLRGQVGGDASADASSFGVGGESFEGGGGEGCGLEEGDVGVDVCSRGRI